MQYVIMYLNCDFKELEKCKCRLYVIYPATPVWLVQIAEMWDAGKAQEGTRHVGVVLSDTLQSTVQYIHKYSDIHIFIQFEAKRKTIGFDY